MMVQSSPSSPTFPHSATTPLLFRPPSSSSSTNPSNITARSDVRSWDIQRVGRWLLESNLPPHVVDTFRQHDITGSVLLDVDQAALKEMGIRAVGDRVKITVAIKQLRTRSTSILLSSPALSSSTSRPSSANTTTRPVPPPLHLSPPSISQNAPIAYQVTPPPPPPPPRRPMRPSTAPLLPSPSINSSQIGYAVGRGPFTRPTTSHALPSAIGTLPILSSPPNANSLDAVMRKAVKFEADNTSKMVAVADCKDGAEILSRVLKKFGLQAADDWAVYTDGLCFSPTRMQRS